MLLSGFIAGKAVGIYNDIGETSKSFAVKRKRVLPDEKNHLFYKRYVQLYENIFNRVRDIYIDLKNIPDFSS